MICVIKLGGSLSDDDRLANWLSMLVQTGVGRVVIVPGGGPYANVVREQQRRWKFSDEHAHRMAVLAMDQFAIQLQGMNTELLLVSTPSEILQVLAKNRVAIWLPSKMILSAPEIAANWDITADSLAAWLARTLSADQLILVKSCDIPVGATVEELVQRGIVDSGFPKMTEDARYAFQVVSIECADRVRSDLINFR